MDIVTELIQFVPIGFTADAIYNYNVVFKIICGSYGSSVLQTLLKLDLFSLDRTIKTSVFAVQPHYCFNSKPTAENVWGFFCLFFCK